MNLPLYSDEYLIKSVLSGKSEAFNIFTARYQERMRSYLSRFLYQDHESIESVLQTVAARTYQKLPDVDKNISVQLWVYRITHKEAVKYLKKRSTRKRLAKKNKPNPSIKWVNSVDTRNDTVNLVQQALNSIKPSLRAVIILYYYEKMTYQEISEVLRIPVTAVDAKLKRALKQTIQKSHVTIAEIVQPKPND
jgi:RNA polymerase sigma-70 factor (ECF subfamily)